MNGKEMKKVEEKASQTEINELIIANSQIFKKNLTLILQILGIFIVFH